MKKNQEDYWNIYKGIAIILIILGHSCYFASAYVYTFHLALFFFVSGYFYNESKYGDRPELNLAMRFKSIWPKYVIYASLVALLHNFFVKNNFIVGFDLYSKRELLVAVLNTIAFSTSELFQGALWFVPVILISSSLFGLIIYISRKYSKNVLTKNVLIVFITFIVGSIGIYLNLKDYTLVYHCNTSFLVIPLFTIGYFCRNYISDFKKYLKMYIAIPLAIIIHILVTKFGFYIELSQNQICNVYIFYAYACMGIYICMTLSKYIALTKILSKLFAFWGEYSFEIMALHFCFLKLIDVSYARMIGETDPTIIGAWVTSYSKELWFVYAIIGATIPACIGYSLNYLLIVINKKYSSIE